MYTKQKDVSDKTDIHCNQFLANVRPTKSPVVCVAPKVIDLLLKSACRGFLLAKLLMKLATTRAGHATSLMTHKKGQRVFQLFIIEVYVDAIYFVYEKVRIAR